METRYPSYAPDVRRAIDRGYVVRGMDAEQTFLALGEPICRKRIEYEGRPVDVWVYPPGGRDPCNTGELRIYFEQGLVTRSDRFTLPTRMTSPPGSKDF